MEEKRFFEIVASRPKPGKEAEYNQWYDQHVKEVFEYKSMKKVTRTHCFYPLGDKGSYDPNGKSPQYITLYEFGSKEDLLDFWKELFQGVFSGPDKDTGEALYDIYWAGGYESGVTLKR